MPARIRRSDPGIFSVSFLDIMACATGSVLFILVVVVMQGAVRIHAVRGEGEPSSLPPDLSTVDLARLGEKRTRLLAEAEGLARALGEREDARSGSIQELAAAEETRLAVLRARLLECRRESETLDQEVRRRTDAKAEKDREIALGVRAGRLEELVHYRIPEVRVVAQELGLVIDCALGRAYVVDPENHEFYARLVSGGVESTEARNVRGRFWLWDLALQVDPDQGIVRYYLSESRMARGTGEIRAVGQRRKAAARGESPEDLAADGSELGRVLRSLDPDLHLVRFNVRPSGLAALRAARARILARSFLYNWYPYEEDQPDEEELSPRPSGGGGGSLAQ